MMDSRTVICHCNKRLKSQEALLQHQRDSPRHVNAPSTSGEMPPPYELVERLSLQDQEPAYGVRRADQCKMTTSAKCTKFIPFSGGGPTTFFARNPDIRLSSWSNIMSPAQEQNPVGEESRIGDEGKKSKKKMKKKKEKTRQGSMPNVNRGSGSTWRVNANTGYTMDLFEDQNWALCDGDCGWCGHCGDGIL